MSWLRPAVLTIALVNRLNFLMQHSYQKVIWSRNLTKQAVNSAVRQRACSQSCLLCTSSAWRKVVVAFKCSRSCNFLKGVNYTKVKCKVFLSTYHHPKVMVSQNAVLKFSKIKFRVTLLLRPKLNYLDFFVVNFIPNAKC